MLTSEFDRSLYVVQQILSSQEPLVLKNPTNCFQRQQEVTSNALNSCNLIVGHSK
jgi:hypothetical protein